MVPKPTDLPTLQISGIASSFQNPTNLSPSPGNNHLSRPAPAPN
jgi:hypothetical protein